MSQERVAILMGSQNDWDVMKGAADALDKLGVAWEAHVISAHRTPERLTEYVNGAEANGIRVFVCGAGHAAALPGVVAAQTLLPVLGVPLPSSDLDGMDALLAIVQMPGGIPVGSLAIGKAGAKNAGLMAAAILALGDAGLKERLVKFREEQAAAVPTGAIASS